MARDIDLFAVFDGDCKTGRVDMTIDGFDKKVSAYLIRKSDLYDDIIYQKFGSKLTTFFFHGYKCLYGQDKCKLFYLDSMKSLIAFFRFKLYKNPRLFFKWANFTMYKYSPMFAKSGLDFYTEKSLADMNYSLYTEFYTTFKTDKTRYFAVEDLRTTAQQFVLFFRSCKTADITRVDDKKAKMMRLLQDNKPLLIKEYGKKRYEELTQSFINAWDFEGVEITLPYCHYDKIAIK